jgi:hypothetical protein
VEHIGTESRKRTAADYLERPLRLVLVRPVRVSLDDAQDVIRWTLYEGGQEPRELEAPADLWSDFCRLSDPGVPARLVADFARRWGVLGPTVGARFGLFVGLRHLKRGSEPVWLWRRAAAKTGALIRLWLALADQRKGDSEDWELAVGDTNFSRPVDLKPRERRQLLQLLLEDWLDLSRPSLRTVWSGLDPVLRVESGHALTSLMCAVAYQLTFALTSEQGVALCSDCNRPYLPSRRPAVGRECFCPDCGVAGSWKLSKRKTRAAAAVRQEGSRHG